MASTHVVQAPRVSSSGEDLKEQYADAVPVTSQGQVLMPNVEYERYLELHHQFEGPARKKFIRKCEFEIGSRPFKRCLESDRKSSGSSFTAYLELPISDVFLGQEQCWKRKGRISRS